MDRKEFGKLIAALREEHLDFSARGMGVWTQAKLAKEANLPEKAISQIEQGRKMNLDAQTMTQLARALKLTATEQVEFFAAAAEVGADPQYILREGAAPALQTLLKLIGEIRLPAFICDHYTNVLASNTLALAVLNIPERMIQAAPTLASGFNLLRVVFAAESPFRQLMGEQWATRAEDSLRYFRTTTLRYRHTERFHAILAELSTLPSFRERWFTTQNDDPEETPTWTTYTYHHPDLGQLSFIAHISTTLTDQGALYLTTYLPCTKETAELFEGFIRRHGLGVRRFAQWPYQTE
ncbi:MAG: XRE family transcriptional regulator [Caldilinea sp. CFX5]|nr:XRE family transcriptional regulator [Caldilinea sp. CFX5]